ncbi:MAG: MBL fold metallo-hydrolase [Chloroflexota bacterium]
MNIINIGYHATNYYVIADSAPILLVDAGWPGSLQEMQHASNRMGIRLANIRYQMATHYHPDHAGLVEELKRLGIQLIVMDTQLAAVPLLRNHVKPRDNFTDIELAGSIVLAVDDSRDFLAGIGILGEIISTPGHSDDSVTLVLDEGAAFTGDLTPPMAVPDDPEDLAYKSWAKIRALGVKTIYPGHGPARPL